MRRVKQSKSNGFDQRNQEKTLAKEVLDMTSYFEACLSESPIVHKFTLDGFKGE